ncbi:hypothetical protein CDAR_393931 [Caerostris darwini]|uniref:Uncharacterized protein n=1 Tax=Caerostris darwini TaxID=1538125 RepID=A0AAV4SY84_9ARAC|nr:hypothetical protein CDAR_393931 [Caerostris darwini]
MRKRHLVPSIPWAFHYRPFTTSLRRSPESNVTVNTQVERGFLKISRRLNLFLEERLLPGSVPRQSVWKGRCLMFAKPIHLA